MRGEKFEFLIFEVFLIFLRSFVINEGSRKWRGVLKEMMWV